MIAAFLSHRHEKIIRTHEIKIQKYTKLIEEIAKFVGNEPDWIKLRSFLNEALLFASDGVVREILKFNKRFTELKSSTDGNFRMTEEDIRALIIEIRKDLYLKSKSINKEGLSFFQKS